MANVLSKATLILPDEVRVGDIRWDGPRIEAVGEVSTQGAAVMDLSGYYVGPGLIDLHVHGGDGVDFMDGTEEAFRRVCR
jgi:N-acetylglucosamine-6-phosphate deacetylase